MSTVDHINTALENNHDSWRDHLYAVRSVTGVLDFGDTSPDEDRRGWQLPLITAFQRVAFADADSGGVLDIANWCLKQAVTLHQVYSNDVDLLICRRLQSFQLICTYIEQSSVGIGYFGPKSLWPTFTTLNKALLAVEKARPFTYPAVKKIDA